MSLSADMGNGFRSWAITQALVRDTSIGPADAGDNDTESKITHAGVGLACTVGDLTLL